MTVGTRKQHSRHPSDATSRTTDVMDLEPHHQPPQSGHFIVSEYSMIDESIEVPDEAPATGQQDQERRADLEDGAAAEQKDDLPAMTANDDDSNSKPRSGNNEPFKLQFMTGIKEDLKARLPYYADDWGRPKSIVTVLNATVYAYVIQLIPALIFAEVMDRGTEGNLSTAETLLGGAVAGMIYAIFAGQPLTVLGITGLVAVLVSTSYSLAATFNADYFPFFFWTCLWAGVFHMISAMTGVLALVWKVTPFTTQIFEMFTGMIFTYLSLEELIGAVVRAEDSTERSRQYASLLLGLLTMYIAWTLHFAEEWTSLTRKLRIFLSGYNTMIAIVVVTAVSYAPVINQAGAGGSGGLERVNVEFPYEWQPTVDRPWVANPLQGIDAAGIFAAMIPGFIFLLLFFIDHNVSSILSQTAYYNLKKPPAYHWDFFIIGLIFMPCAILGLPPSNGLIPQAPLHTRALCTREFYVDEYGVKRERITHCEEKRWSNFSQAALLLLTLAAFRVISWIPRGALFGLLLYLGMGSFHGSEVFERLLMMFMMPKRRPQISVVRNVNWRVVQSWTLIQTISTLIIWVVAIFATGVGFIYPILLFLLVPLRSFVLGRFFSERDMAFLDPFGDEDAIEQYHEEQKMFHSRRPRGESFDSEELDFPSRAEFRGQGRKEFAHLVRRHSLTDADIDDIIPMPYSKEEHTAIRRKSIEELVSAAEVKAAHEHEEAPVGDEVKND